MYYIYANLMTHKRLAFTCGFISFDKALDFLDDFCGVSINETHLASQPHVSSIGYTIRKFKKCPPERFETPC